MPLTLITPIVSPGGGHFGGAADYSAFDAGGTLRAAGGATCFLDLLQSVTGAQITSPAGDFVQNIPEASVTAKISARYPTDYITTNWQINHNWKLGSSIYPHLHWWQTTANTPHWILGYRWQIQGAAKVTSWTPAIWAENVFDWTAGTLNQITRFPAIVPPEGYGQVSDILQVRLYRDYTNASELFDGGDPVNAGQDIVNMDCHIEVDMFGSATEYAK